MEQVRGTTWSVTINNPVGSDDEQVASARQRSGWSVYGQKEVGDNGTPHYQLMVRTPQVRFSAVKKAFPRGHIELARDPKALEKYVQKEDTRVGALPANELYPSLQTLWDKFADYTDVHYKKYGPHASWSSEYFLERFDHFIYGMIEEGYVVETMGVNPQMRSSVKLYGSAIINRSKGRRQTDRQTAEDEVSPTSITNASTNEPGPEESGLTKEVQSCAS